MVIPVIANYFQDFVPPEPKDKLREQLGVFTNHPPVLLVDLFPDSDASPTPRARAPTTSPCNSGPSPPGQADRAPSADRRKSRRKRRVRALAASRLVRMRWSASSATILILRSSSSSPIHCFDRAHEPTQ